MSNAGLATIRSYFSADNFFWVTGMMLLANKNASPVTSKAKINKGRMKRSSGIPEDLMATNSNDSPRFPKVMIAEKSNERGRAVGIQNNVTSPTSLPMVGKSRPLPTRSSIYNQKNCMVSTKTEIEKAATNGPIKDLMMRISSFFITLCRINDR